MKRTSLLLLATAAACAEPPLGVPPPAMPPEPAVVVELPPPPSSASAPLQVAGEDAVPFQCNGGMMVVAGGRQYCVQKRPASFFDSERWCASNGGHLAMIGSDDESRALQRVLGSPIGFEQSAWIGLVEPQEGRWVWSTGAPLTVERWAPGEPNNAGGDENCGEVYPNSGLWNDLVCGAARALLCESRPPRAGAAPGKLRCSGASFRAGSIEYCYERSRLLSWIDAEHACKAQGGTLASFKTHGEIDAFQAAISGPLGSDRAWIGFTDEGHEGRWTTVTGRSPAFTRWGSGEPNNAGGNENCAEWYTANGLWNDIPCDLPHVGICAPR
jgi:hypothetical protein